MQATVFASYPSQGLILGLISASRSASSRRCRQDFQGELACSLPLRQNGSGDSTAGKGAEG